MQYLGTPHEPELEDVVVATALHGLVAGIVANVVRLVLLEQVVSGHLIRLKQQSLKRQGSFIASFIA